MIIGVDLDGVLADFLSAYNDFLIDMTGKNLFPKDYNPRHPPTWHFPPVFGYTKEEYDRSWKELAKRDDFWFTLQPEPGGEAAIQRLDTLTLEHDVYFLTHRIGIQSKLQTEAWLTLLGMLTPTVLLTSQDKMPLIRGLALDVYIDDRGETMQDYARELDEMAEWYPKEALTRLYLVDRSYNQEMNHLRLTRVTSVMDALDRERL